jgi:uncharacterized membrane protein YkvA (DUF1232 family)
MNSSTGIDDATRGGTATETETPEQRMQRERLERESERVSEKDMNRIDRDMPRKLANVEELKDGMEWIGEMIGRVTVLYDMVRDPGFKVNGKTMTIVAAGLLYFLLPLDMTPDFIPGLGYIDDALVLGTLWKVVQSEVDRYLSFRERSTLGA